MLGYERYKRMIDVPIKELYNVYLENLLKSPFKLETITVKDICNKIQVENFDKGKKYNDQKYFIDINYTKMANDILDIGTYWHFITLFKNGKYEVIEGVHRAWALQLATLSNPKVFNKKILSITITDENLGEVEETSDIHPYIRKHQIVDTFPKTITVKLINPKKFPLMLEKFSQYKNIRLDRFNDKDNFISVDTNSYKIFLMSIQQYSRVLQNRIEGLSRDERKKLVSKILNGGLDDVR
jgi:hypothetical protein